MGWIIKYIVSYLISYFKFLKSALKPEIKK